MTPPDDQPDSREFERTIKLMRCSKHGLSYYLGDNCPECEKESTPSDPPPKEAE